MTGQPREFERLILAAGAAAVRRVQLRAFQALTSGTPVDTGFARSGWVPSFGSPVLDRVPAPGERGTAVQAAISRFAENRARALSIAGTYNIALGPVFISNAVPYIVRLNEGHSSQAPAMFVERAVEIAARATL